MIANSFPEPKPLAIKRSPPTYIPAIEALRGLAALYVVAFHLLHVPTVRVQAPDAIAGFLDVGQSGVTLFFVISAFTLCLSSENRASETRPLLRFYLRRIFRIVPLFWVLLAVTIVRTWHLYHVRPNLFAVGASLTFLYNFIPGHQEGIVWASWTLGVEMVFYAFFPLIFSRVNTLGRGIFFFFAAVSGAVLLCALVGNDRHYFYFSVFRHLPAFAAGIAMFYLFKGWTSKRPAWVPLALVAFGCLGHWFLWRHRFTDYGQTIAVQSLVWVSLALGLCLRPLVLFVNRTTQFFGEISYSVYLVHPLILFSLSPVIALFAGMSGRGPHFIACLVAAITAVTVVAICTYRCIEQPGIRLGSRLIKRHSVAAEMVACRTSGV